MIIPLLIAFFSLVSLLIIHEFGHFILAKKFGVKVEEFGIGLPPRIFGKKFGETLYSLNLIPLGAFVKLEGEEPGSKKGPRSFSTKPVWQRSLIILGGVVSFWIIAVVIMSFIYGIGAPIPISDEDPILDIDNPRVQVLMVTEGSPADEAGIIMGDVIESMIYEQDKSISIDKVKEVQDFSSSYKGEEITLLMSRGERKFETSLVPRVNVPEGEGAMGVSLARIATKQYPFYKAPLYGILATADLTFAVVQGWGKVLFSLVRGEGVPAGAEVVGPVGIFQLFLQMESLGLVYFLRFLALLSIFLALFNILPIPALDGGRFVFLIIEGLKGRSVNPKLEQKLTAACFIFLIGIMVLITIRDIINLF